MSATTVDPGFVQVQLPQASYLYRKTKSGKLIQVPVWTSLGLMVLLPCLLVTTVISSLGLTDTIIKADMTGQSTKTKGLFAGGIVMQFVATMYLMLWLFYLDISNSGFWNSVFTFFVFLVGVTGFVITVLAMTPVFYDKSKRPDKGRDPTCPPCP